MEYPINEKTETMLWERGDKDMQITVDDVLSWHPCEDYRTRKKLLTITGGRESLTPEEVLDLDIPWEDRLWVLLREPIFTEIELRLLACDFAEHVLPIWEDWARNVLPKHLEAPRNLIRIVKVFPDQPDAWISANTAAWEARLAAWIAGDNAGDNSDARDASNSAGAAGSDWNFGAAGAANVAAGAAMAANSKEKKWQIEHVRGIFYNENRQTDR
jgi:hypothetical protein